MRTGPRARALLTHDRSVAAKPAAPSVVLELDEDVWAGVPCWSNAERWAVFTVPVAYSIGYERDVRPVMPHNPVSLKAVCAVAAARASYADWRTGRNCRPSNERLAADTGLSVRTVQRATTVLRLLGVATEVLRGRQRTRAERFGSWRLSDRSRGWASVWALHVNRQLSRVTSSLSPHPRSGQFCSSRSLSSVVTTKPGSPAGRRNSGAARRRSIDSGGQRLAVAWRGAPGAPPWSRRHSPAAWAAVLAGPAGAGWTPRDLNQLIADWAAVHGRWVPDQPHKPIGLLGAILAWHRRHGSLTERPAALDEAREAQELAATRERIAAAAVERDAGRQARAIGKAAAAGPGRAQAFQALERAQRASAERRADAAAAEVRRIEELVARQRDAGHR